MNTDIPRVSTIAAYPAQPCNYGFWTKVVRSDTMLPVGLLMREWLEDNTTKRVIIGRTHLYFENEKDATYFNLTH